MKHEWHDGDGWASPPDHHKGDPDMGGLPWATELGGLPSGGMFH